MDENDNGSISLNEFRIHSQDLYLPSNFAVTAEERFKVFQPGGGELEFDDFIKG